MFLEDARNELDAVRAYQRQVRRSDWRARSIPRANVARLNAAADRWPLLDADTAMATARNPVLAETFDILGELSTRRWMRDHPMGLAYGRRMVTRGMRRAARSGPAIGPYPHGWSTRQFERIELGERAVGAELEEEMADYEKRLRTGRTPALSEEEVQQQLAEHRQALSTRETGVRYQPREAPLPAPGGGGGGAGEFLRRVTGTPEPGSPLERHYAGLTEQAITTPIRTGMMALDFPVQEFQGQIRNLYGWTRGRKVNWIEPQSDALISLQTGLDAGSGFFVDPESEVAQERRRREAERGQIGGHNVTLGRWAADVMPFAADTKPWMMVSGLVDLGVQIADPSAYVLGKGAQLSRLRDMFANPELYEKAGLWAWARKSIAGPDAMRFMDSKDGTKAIEWLTSETDPARIRWGLRNKVNLDLAAEIADTRTIDETRAILQRELGRGIRQPSTIRNVGFGTDPITGGRLPFSSKGRPRDMPIRGEIDAHDKDIVANQLEKWAFNVEGISDAQVGGYISRLARIEDPKEINKVIRDALNDADLALAEVVPDKQLRSILVKLHENATEQGSRTWHDALTKQGPTNDAINVGEELHWDAGAHLYVEHAPRWLTLPDARDIRRVQSNFRFILARSHGAKFGKLRWPLALAESFTNELWKPVQLATRIAWPVRVIGEEQIRMAVAGYDSMFNHPISFIAGQIANRPGSRLDRIGNPMELADEFKASMTRTNMGLLDRPVVTGVQWSYRKDHIYDRAAYDKSWADEIARLANDPVAAHVARADSLEESKEWFSRGGGLKYKRVLAQEQAAKFEQLGADDYIESVARRIRQHTGGNPELMDAVRTGRFRGGNILDQGHLDPTFKKQLSELTDEFGPDEIVGEFITSGRREGFKAGWDRTVDTMMSWLMSKPSNRFSRSEVFTQAYEKEAARLEGLFPDMPVKEVDAWAKGFALDETKSLLYDLTTKGRTMDAWRVVFPFGEAWREVMTTWFSPGIRRGQPVGLLWKNPKTIRRFQQIIQGGRGEQLGEFLGIPQYYDAESGEWRQPGLFGPNQWGEEVLFWPGSELITDRLVGVPWPATGRLKGLSMFGQAMPGLGPVVQIPVGWLASARPSPQVMKETIASILGAKPFGGAPLIGGTVQEQLFPFGTTGAESQAEVFSTLEYMPAWMRTAIQGATRGDVDNRQWATTVMEMAGSLKSEGGFDDSQGDQNRLYEEASGWRAAVFYGLKALSAAILPTAPDFEQMVKDNNGQAIRAWSLAAELGEMRKEDYETSGQRFLDKYGSDLYAVIATPKTTSSIYAIPATRDGVAWVEANPGIEDKLPNTYGFFAPEGGDPDFTLYNLNLRKGGAIRLDPKRHIELYNHTLGNLEYQQYVEEVEAAGETNTKVGRRYLELQRERIYDERPGWRDERGLLNKAPDRTFIDELYKAARLPAIRRTDAGQGLRDYLRYHKEVVADAEKNGYAWPGTSRAALPARIFLNDRAQEIIREHPDFKKVYDYILSRETEELEDVAGND